MRCCYLHVSTRVPNYLHVSTRVPTYLHVSTRVPTYLPRSLNTSLTFDLNQSISLSLLCLYLAHCVRVPHDQLYAIYLCTYLSLCMSCLFFDIYPYCHVYVLLFFTFCSIAFTLINHSALRQSISLLSTLFVSQLCFFVESALSP